MANALELHHLLSHSCSPFTNQLAKEGDNPMNTLHDIPVYTFQQMFYTVSKVLLYVAYQFVCVVDGQSIRDPSANI